MNIPQFQLALQIPAGLLGGRATLVELEDKIREAIYGIGKIDTTTSDDDEADIFISSNDPQRIFRHIKPYLETFGILDKVQAAYRRTDENDYTVIWPAEEEEDGGMLM